MKDYGKVNYKGIEITLTEAAHWEYMSNSTEPDNWMVANGIDKDGNKYRVEFKVREEYADQIDEIDDMESCLILKIQRKFIAIKIINTSK